MGVRTGYVTEALVLRTIPFGDTSQVVHLATPEHGLVAALAKGAHRPGSAVEGGLALLSVGQAWLRPPTRKDDGDGLELLQRFRQRDGWRGLAKDLDRYRSAAYVLELLRTWMKPALPIPALYAAGVTALRALATCALEAVPAWVVWFEARAGAAAGHRPAIEACAACGEPLLGTLAFSPPAGGAIHRRCAPPGPVAALPPQTLTLLQRLYTQRLPEFVGAPMAAAEVRRLRRLHDLWMPWLLERQPASLGGLPS
jgi:DNA repair protein RecO (recombination protein O)